VISYRDIVKTFGPTRALAGLTLEIRTGEVFGLLGPNGAGKSTLMNITAGLIRQDGGEVAIGGHAAGQEGISRALLGVAPQALALYDELTAEENLRFFGGLYGMTGGTLAERVAWTLDFAGLTDRRSDRVKSYSGGMKRRLNLAVALIHDPRTILLDEPTVGVDPQSRNAIFDGIETLHREGRTIVYTTHYMEEAERLCDRVGIIDHGQLLALGTVGELVRKHGGGSSVIVGHGDGEDRIVTDDPVAAMIRLKEEGRLRGLRLENPTLESVFLNLTGRHLRD